MPDLVVVADSHIAGGEGEPELFARFLGSLAGRTELLVHLGDVFNVWLGRRRFETRAVAIVVEALRHLSRAGTAIHLAEGNRDFHIADGYLGDPFVRVVPDGEEILFGGLRWHISHGDLVNEADRPYRTWRRLSRSGPVWGLVSCLPGRAAVMLAEALERRLRSTGRRYKSGFPLEACMRWGRRRIEAGCDRVLIGHLHEERVLELESGGRHGRMIVMPDWLSTRRYLRIDATGRERFEEFAA